MFLRGSSRRKVISISGAPEAFLVSGAKFFFLAAGDGTIATTPLFSCLCRKQLEGNRSEWNRDNLILRPFIFPLLSLELSHQLPQIPYLKIYLDWWEVSASSLTSWGVFQRSICLACFKSRWCLAAIIICFSCSLLFQWSYGIFCKKCEDVLFPLKWLHFSSSKDCFFSPKTSSLYVIESGEGDFIIFLSIFGSSAMWYEVEAGAPTNSLNKRA